MVRPLEASPALIYKDGEDIILDGDTFSPTVHPVYSATVTLTDAQIKALPTTPVEIVPAPGGSQAVVFLNGFIVNKLVADYTNTSSPYFWFQDTGETTDLSAFLEMPGLTEAAQNGFYARFSGYDSVPALYNVVNAVQSVNSNIAVIAGNGLGNFTGGNAANTLPVTVHYTLIDV